MTELYRLFAEIMDYPGAELGNHLNDCIALLSMEHPAAAELLKHFQIARQAMPANRLEEIYTTTFDMRPDCTLNLGYHLFSDDWRRSIFLAKLNELYDALGFKADGDLPDYLPIVLRFLAIADVKPEAAELVEDGLIPAISRIIQAMTQEKKEANPYEPALESLSVWLRNRSAADCASEASQQTLR